MTDPNDILTPETAPLEENPASQAPAVNAPPVDTPADAPAGEAPAQPNAAPEQQPQTGWQPPQQTQYGYQQPQYNAQPQTGWQPPQPRYNYQQPQQPQYGYQQPQQPQYGYQQPRQPQYGYQQPQQPQYGYQQPRQPQYNQYQPVPSAPVNPSPLGHTKAIGSMVMMIISLALLLYPLISYLINNFDGAFSYGGTYTWLVLVGHFCMLTGLILMLVGAIIGSRGKTLFGVGLLLLIPVQIVKRIYFTIMMLDYYEVLGVFMLVFGVMLIVGTVLAGIGCLARRKGLKVTGGVLMLVGFAVGCGLYIIMGLGNWGIEWLEVDEPLYYFGCIFACIATLLFPIRRPQNG